MSLSKWLQIYGYRLILFAAIQISIVCYAGDESMPTDQFFSLILEAVKAFGGIPWTLKIASIITVVISSMKVSFIRPFWEKLGWIKGIVAPLLGLLAGILLLTKEQSLTLPGVFAYMFAGAGAIVLHEMLDGVKAIPGIGDAFVSIINFLQNVLKAPKTTQ
jgi:hypothetical protein